MTSVALVRAFLAMVIVGVIVMFAFIFKAHARDNGQWAQLQLEPGETIEDRIERSAWFNRQKMPDNPRQSCCGQADAYYADKVFVDGNDVYAVITDERPDEPLSRPHIKPGTKIFVPPEKNKDTRADPNPTGHTIIFVQWYEEDDEGHYGVFCYLPEGGV